MSPVYLGSSVSASGLPVGQHQPPLHASVRFLLVPGRRIPDLPLARRRLPIRRVKDDEVGVTFEAKIVYLSKKQRLGLRYVQPSDRI